MTAVEFFLTELEKMQYFIGNDMLEAYKQALEMEKQQIIDAYNFSEIPHLFKWDAEQYYNETYKKP
jgi:hypothetical protein